MVRWLVAVALVGSIAVTGCGSSGSTTTTAVKAAVKAAAASGAAASGAAASSAAASSAAAGSNAPVVACKIVTKADVQAVFGGTVSEGVPGKFPEYCDFTLTGTLKSGTAVGVMGATVNVWWINTPLDNSNNILNAAATTVPELGVAFYNPNGRVLLVAYHGGSLYYQDGGACGSDASCQAALVALAKATKSR